MSHIATNWAFAVRGIPPMAKLVLIALADRHNKDTNLCCPDQKMIAADVCMSDRTVRKFVNWLEHSGLISKRIQSKGIGVTTYYTLHLGITEAQPVETNRKDVPKGQNDQSEGGPTGTSVTTNRNVEDNQTEAAFRNKGTGSNRNQPESSVSKETDKGSNSKPSKPRPEKSVAEANAALTTKSELQKAGIYSVGVALLKAEGIEDQVARRFLGGLIKKSSIAIVHAAIQAASQDPPIDARGFLSGVVEKRARQAGLRRAPETKPGQLATDVHGEPVDWSEAVERYRKSGWWNSKKLGERPDELRYRGPLKPLEALLATGRFGGLDVRIIRLNIERLRAEQSAA